MKPKMNHPKIKQYVTLQQDNITNIIETHLWKHVMLTSEGTHFHSCSFQLVFICFIFSSKIHITI